MINFIWAALIIIGFIVGAITGNLDNVTTSAIESAKGAVELAMGLIGVMALWLGIMKIAEDSGLIKGISRLLKPIMILLFPDVPADHPAMGAMIMNISANILGLGNAATPFGLKAMEELQKLNRQKDTATDAMVTFLAINTSSVTLIPASTIAILAAAGATNPTQIVGPTIIATTISTTTAIIAAKTLQRLPKYKIKRGRSKGGRQNVH
ncbi:nucleoside recognition domain-containing protein [Tissierella sp. MB52-C2]|uniref:nucleoside recognition domain-containing protein n=1 Tax=Tissierella sp. MB52-C2 TaxID=3070999 RepID=UPI00280B13E0|nr:nucleoside recognition domain-containing protein [Tissierella sp. MB52-C2]WMM24374.1 nucleoside recognition domain-containing protein [Tissierella sp. MB52-C2]